MSNLDSARVIFSEKLNNKLFLKYKKKVTIAFFVNEFNLRAHGTNAISYEAGRKWIKGLSIPETSKLKVLSEWLGADLLDMFQVQEKGDIREDDYKNAHNLLQCVHSLIPDLNTKNQIFILFSILVLKEMENKALDFPYPKIIKQFDIEKLFKELE
jgi:hypothetical protein